MKYKKKRDNQKPLAVALGVILALAPGAVIIDKLEPVSVYAMTDEEFEQSEVFQDWLGDRIADIGDHWTRYLFTSNDPELATLAAVAYAVSCQDSWYLKLKNAVDADVEFNSDGAVYAGYYRIENNGQIYPGTISMHNSISSGGTLVVHSQHFNMQIGFRSSNLNFNGSELRFSSEIVGSSIRYSASNSADYSCVAWWNDSSGYLSGTGSKTIQANSTEPIFVVGFGTSSNIPVVSGSGSANGKVYLGSGGIPSLPELGSPMSYAEPWEYYNDLVDYLNDNYELPEGIVGEPYSPYSPEFADPTDAYPGIPKSWTIENPQLPTSPQIGFNAYNVDTSDYDVSSTLTEYTDGFGFWWWLTGKCLDVTNTKGIVIAAIILGLVGFILWRLGGSL